MNKRLGQRIRRARKQEELTQSALGKKIGVSQALIWKWESGGAGAAKYLADLEKVLGPLDGKAVKNDPITGEDQDVEADFGPSDFGIWVREERTRLGMSVAELAENSNLSKMAIYNIERGRIQSPQKKTQDSIAMALSSTVPTEIEAEVKAEEDDTPEGVGSLTDFDPYSKADWPACGGVYVLYDRSQRPIYVGKAQKIAKRLKDHEEKFWFKRPIVEYASFVAVSDKLLRHQLEQTMIRFLKSNAVINKQSTDDFEKQDE